MKFSFPLDWRVLAPVLVISAGICWGLIGLFSQNLAALGLTAVQITVVRCVLATVFLAFYLLAFRRSAFCISIRHIWMFIGTGVLSIAFFNVCYFACIQFCGLSFAAILLYTAPCFVVLLSAVLFKERLTRQKVIALCVAFVGCLLVVGIGTGSSTLSVVGIAFGLGSGIGYALYSLFARVALKNYRPVTVMFYTFLCASIALVPFAQVQAIIELGTSMPFAGWLMVGLALVSTVVPFACYTVGLAHMETGRASIMAFVEPMVALIIGVGVFHDVLTVLNGVGIVLIISAVALLNIAPDKIAFLRDTRRLS